MSRTTVALLAVAGLVALAGCGAVLPGGDATPNPDADLEPADPPYATPLEDSDLLADHVDALESHGSFTFVRNSTLHNTDDQAYPSRKRVHADFGDGRVLATFRPEPVSQIYRFGNGSSYLRTAAGDSWSYERNPPTNQSPREVARSPAESLLSIADFEHAGATTSDGERVHVYRAIGPEAVNESVLAPGADDPTVNRFHITLTVRDSGLVTEVVFQYAVSIAGDERRQNTTVTLSEFGDTDASPPMWLDDARNATSGGME